MPVFTPKGDVLADDVFNPLSTLADTLKKKRKASPPLDSAIGAGDKLIADEQSRTGRATRQVPDMSGEAALPEAPGKPEGNQKAEEVGERDMLLFDQVSDLFGFANPFSLLEDPLEKAGKLTEQESTAEARRIIDTSEATAKRYISREAEIRKDALANAQKLGFDIDKDVVDAEVKAENERVMRAAKVRRDMAQMALNGQIALPQNAWWLDAIHRYRKGGTDMIIGMLKYPTALWELVEASIEGGEPERSALRAYLDGAQKAVDKAIPTDALRDRDFIQQVATGGGGMSVFMLSNLLASSVGIPGLLGTAVTGGMAQGTAGYEDAERYGAELGEKWFSLIGNTALGLTEAIGVERALSKLFRAGLSGDLIRALKMTAASSIEELAQEFGQSLGGDVLAKTSYDTQREMDFDEYFRNGLVGGALGVVGGGGGAAISLASRSSFEATPDEIDAVQLERAGRELIEQNAEQFNQILAELAPFEQPAEVDVEPVTLEEFEIDDPEGVARALSRPGWAIVTGTQEALGDYTAPENMEADRQLRERLADREFREVGGTYEGVDQGPSYLVQGTEEEMLELAKEFNQESILTNRGLVYTDGSVVPAVPDNTIIGPEARETDFYSTLPSGVDVHVGLDFGTGEESVAAAQATAEFDQQRASRTPEQRVRELADEIPGLRGVARHLLPDELEKLQRASANRIVQLVNEFPSAQEMAAVAIAGRPKKGWYARSAKALVDIFGAADAPRFAALLAALSPQTTVPSNAVNALRMWVAWDKAGRPTDPKAIFRIMGENTQGDKGEESILGAWKANTIRALTADDFENFALSGPKVNSFMLNLLGNTVEVTNDAWMANYALVNQNLFQRSGTAPGKSPGYVAMAAAVRRAAATATRITGEEWTPAEVQETIWSWARALYEKSKSEGSLPSELLAAGDLTEADILDTPDFATLFASNVYRKILEEGGYDVDSLATSGGSPDSTRGEPVGEGTGFAEDAFERHLRRAAKRLDRLKIQRAEQKQKARQQRKGQEEPVQEDPETLVPPEALAGPLPDPNLLSPSTAQEIDDGVELQLEPADASLRGGVLDAGAGIGGDGLKFRDFFADVTEGTRQQPEKLVSGEATYEPAISLEGDATEFQEARRKYTGNFDTHIQTSIPGFYEVQSIVGDAIVKTYGDGGADVLDIGASEGALVKTMAELSEGRVRGVALDPNPAMIGTFQRLPQAEGASAAFAAFGTAEEAGQIAWDETTSTGEEVGVPFFDAEGQLYDVVHEAMVFQFISNARGGQIARAKELMKPDGVLIIEEKFGGPADQYNANETKKDEYKSKYYTEDQLEAKKKEVLQTGGDAVEGMTDLQVSQQEIEAVLKDQFAHVEQFWSSGNFKGYIASDSPGAVKQLMTNMQDTSSDFTVEDTPRVVQAASEEPEVLEAQTSLSRAPFKGEPVRPDEGIPVTEENEDLVADTSIATLAKQFRDLLELTVLQGKVTGGRRIAGQYSRLTGVIRVRNIVDLSTLAHEAGHAYTDRMSPQLRDFINSNRAQIIDLGHKMYEGGTSHLNGEGKVREGIAELMRLYVTNPDYARRNWPTVVEAFEEHLVRQNPRLKDGLNLISDQLRTLSSLPSAAYTGSFVVSSARPGRLREALDELSDAGPSAYLQERARSAMEETINRWIPLNKLVAKMLNAAEVTQGDAVDLKAAYDPRVLARMARTMGSLALKQVQYGVQGYHSIEETSEGLIEAKLVSQGLDRNATGAAFDENVHKEFINYLTARALDAEHERQSRLPIGSRMARAPGPYGWGDARQTIADLESKYGLQFTEAAEMVDAYGRALWRKQYDAGLLGMTDEVYKAGLDRKFYVPLMRDMGDMGGVFDPATGSIFQEDPRGLVKRRRGSDRNIIDPLESLMAKTYAVEQAIADNDTKKALAQLADKTGTTGSGLVVRENAYKIVGRQFSVAEVAKKLTGLDDISDVEAADIMAMLSASIEQDKLIAMFRAEVASTAGGDYVLYSEKGKVQALNITDKEVAHDVVVALNGLGRETMPFMTSILTGTSSAFRAAITSWPDFLMVNFIRDQMNAWIVTDVGFKPFISGAKGVARELQQRRYARLASSAGMLFGGVGQAALHDTKVRNDLDAARNRGYIVTAFSDKSPLGVLRGIAKVTELTETGTRLGIFELAYKRALKDGLNDWEAAVEAAYMSTDYMDFGLNGSSMLLLRRTIPFLNAQLQGWYKMMRTLGGDEVRQRKGLMFVLGAYFKSVENLPLSRREKMAIRTGRKAYIKMMTLAGISLALSAMFWDDEDYQETSEYLRNTGWVIPVEPGHISYIPKPFELAIPANIMERAYEYAHGDRRAPQRLLNGLRDSLSLPMSPPLITALAELRSNTDTFSGREIVPYYMQRLPAELQYNQYTSELAKGLGEITGFSPLKLDHFMSSLGASAYRDITTVTNQLNPNRPELSWADIPFVRRFVRNTQRGATSVRDFWEEVSHTGGRLTQAYTSYSEPMKHGLVHEANAQLAELDDDEKAYAILNTHFSARHKRLHPLRRAQDLASVTSKLRRELAGSLGVHNTDKLADEFEFMQFSPKQKRIISDLLGEYSRRSIRNAMITMELPGWDDKRKVDTDYTLQMIRQSLPALAEEMDRRMRKKRVYDETYVSDTWVELKEILLTERDEAYLDDLAAIGESTGW